MSDPDATPTPPVSPPEASTAAPHSPAPEPVVAKPAKPRGLDLSDLKIMPAWVANFGKDADTPVREYRDSENDSQRGRRGDRDQRPRNRFSDDRRGPPQGDRPAFGRNNDRPPGRPAGGPPGFRPEGSGSGPRRDRRDDSRPGSGPRRGHDRDRRDAPQREWVDIPKGITVSVHPDDKSLDALSAHVRSTGHAFSLFDIARLVLAGGERFGVRFLCDETYPQPLYQVTADGSLFFSRDEALQHILRSGALDTFYRAEEFEMEEPKGNFPSVAVCGFSGEVLGPASHHSFQASLIRLHRERFSNLSLEDYKRRVRNDSNPELIQKWKDDQKKGLRWHPITAAPAEGEPELEAPPPLNSRLEVETHFRRHHADSAVKEVRDITVPGNLDKRKLSPALFIMLRQSVEAARKHLFEMSQKLSAGFDRRSLKTFKRRSGKMFVSRVRPRAIDPGTVFAERVTAIVEILKHAPGGLQLADLLKTLVIHTTSNEAAPTAPTHATPVPTEPGAADAEIPATEAPPVAPDSTPSAESSTSDTPSDPTAAETPTAISDDQLAALKDVRWLVNEGYLIEYSDGLIALGVQGEGPTAKRTPEPRTAKATQDVKSEPPTETALDTPTSPETSEEITAPPKDTEPPTTATLEPETVSPTTPEPEPEPEPEPAKASESELNLTKTDADSPLVEESQETTPPV